MPLDTDAILDRRSLRRRLAGWRLGAVALGIAAVALGALALRGGEGGAKGRGPHIAKVELSGVIFGDDRRERLLKDLVRSDARGVMLMIDSPGGGVTASEELYDLLRDVAKDRPVVAVLGQVAASGGYVAAIAADHIIAHKTTITGSIGVLAQYPNFTGLLKTVGVEVESIKSAPLKASPNGVEPTSPEARKAIEALIMDSFAWFKDIVKERRGLDDAQLATVSDGRVWTGRQAVGLKLIDEIGGEKEAMAWLATKGVDTALPVRDWKPKSGYGFGLGAAAAAAADAAGLPGIGAAIRRNGDAVVLDGVLAIWQPS